MTLPRATLERICRYPVKGFTGQDLAAAQLAVGRGLPYDRQLAIVSGNRPEEPAIGGWVPSRTFIQNTIFDDLLTFECRFDPERDQLELVRPDGERIGIDLSDQTNLHDVNTVLAGWFPGGPMGTVRLVRQSPDHGFWDFTDSVLSIINLESVESLGRSAGQTLDPARFRGNFYVDGIPAWEEFSWIGKTIQIGETVLEIIRPILRCAATSVDPESGARDFNVPGLMQQKFGHAFCGVYARVASGGNVQTSDRIDVMDLPDLKFETQPDNAPEQNRWPTCVSARMQMIDGETRPFLQMDHLPALDNIGDVRFRIHDLAMQERNWASFDASIATIGDDAGCALVSGPADAFKAVKEQIENRGSLLVTGPF